MTAIIIKLNIENIFPNKLVICISAEESVILSRSYYIFISLASFSASDGSAYIQDEDVIGSTSLDKARIQHKL